MKKYSNILKYAVIFLIMYIASKAVFGEGIRPFGVSVYLGLVFAGINILLAAPLFIAAELLAAPGFDTLINCLGTALTLMIFALVEKKYFKSKNKSDVSAAKIADGWGAENYIEKNNAVFLASRSRRYYILIGAAAVCSQIGYIYICVLTKFNIVNVVATCVLGTAFSYVCFVCALVFLKNDKFCKLKYNEAACISLFVVITALGLSAISALIKFDITRIVLAFLIMSLLYSAGVKFAITAAVLYGLGVAFASQNISYAGVFALIALAAALFKDSGKPLALAAMALTDIMIQLYFNFNLTGFVFMPVIALLLGGSVSLLLPQKYYSTLKRFSDNPVDGENDFLLLQKQTLQRDLRVMARSYREISTLFENDGIKTVKLVPAHTKITAQLTARLCSDCKNNANCMITLREQTEQAILALVDSSMNKGYASITSVPNFLGSRCGRIEELLKILNALIVQYNNEKAVIESRDSMRETLSAQILGVSKTLEELSDKINLNIIEVPAVRTNILNELSYQKFESDKVHAYKDSGGKLTILIEVKRSTRPDDVLSLLNKITKEKLCLYNVGKSLKEDWHQLEFCSSPVFDVAFGIQSANKGNNKISGDTYSISKISGDKVLIALCDGMGSGSQAEKISNTTISLIESLYRAGFDSHTILTMINKMLIYKNDEIFCALDLAIIDLNTAIVDFIKIGGPYGLIKTTHSVEVVGAGALPIGVLDSVKPLVTSVQLRDNDLVMLASDGVTDCFENNKEFADYLFSIDALNPAVAAERIIEKCVEKDKFLPHDDMTAACARIIRV